VAPYARDVPTQPQPPTPHPSGARPPAIPPDLVPRHIALVMDGNGRWANARGLPRTEGHRRGEAAQVGQRALAGERELQDGARREREQCRVGR